MSKTYTTIQGDTWDLVAKKELGSEKQMHHLLAENPNHEHIFLFPSGVVLSVPEMSTPLNNGPLPPWQR